MFTIFRNRCRRRLGLGRREFLTARAAGLVGLALADLLRAETSAGNSSSGKALINVHLEGGPPQMEMVDLKPAGIADPDSTTPIDPNRRPQHLLDQGQPIRELV